MPIRFKSSSKLFHQVRNALSKLLHSLGTQDCDPIDSKLPTIETNLAALEQQLKYKRR